MAKGKKHATGAAAPKAGAEHVYGTPAHEATTDFARRNPLLVRQLPPPPPPAAAGSWR